MVVNEEWLAGNDEYIERKVLKELKLKRKREEKKSLGRWTRGKERVINVEEDAERKRKIKGKGKEKVVDVEEDAKRKRKIKVKGKEKVVDFEEETMRGLSLERKKVIREMRFEDLIEFPIFEIPTKLAFYVVDILNTTNMTLECPMGDIVITPKIVKQVLGLPMGRRRLEREGQREYNDPFLLQWKDQFRNVNKLTIKSLSDVIIQTKNSDYMFRMNILTLIANTLGSCENSSTVNFTVLKNVFEGDELTYLHYTKFDTLKVKRRLSAFKSWNTSLLKKREITKLQNDYMGIGEIQDVGEGEEPNQKDELYEMLEENINNILIEKSEIEEKINENLIKFQDDETLLQLKQRMKDIFKEPDMPEYLSSSSSESDDDNDDGSQLADENEESYRKETHSNDEDDVEIVVEESPVFDIDNSLQGSQPTFDLGASPTYEKMKILSEKKKKMGLKSKYVNKTVDPAVELTEDEKLLGRSIFSTQEEEEEEVFNDNEGLILFRMNIQSLAPGLEIDTSVIDVYVSILNYEEKFKMTNMKRHFFYTSMMVPGILEDKTKEIDKKIDAQYDRFHEMLLIQMENDVEKMQMEDVELAFFPNYCSALSYLVVFNLKIGKPVIIDNSESDATYEGKYKYNVEFVLYEGSTAAQWKTGLLPEKDKNHRMQMDNLRSRIAAKILLLEVNIHQKKMSDYAKR
ncbi:hypothetical protein Tco_0900417 [Tanacetum coccineum]